MKLRPTHRCFDDALELLQELVSENPESIHTGEYRLVHAVCTATERNVGVRAGEPFSHAWVEHVRIDGTRAFEAFENEAGERVYLDHHAGQLAERLGVQLRTEYSVREAWDWNRRTETFGPWEDPYLSYVAPRGKFRGNR